MAFPVISYKAMHTYLRESKSDFVTQNDTTYLKEFIMQYAKMSIHFQYDYQYEAYTALYVDSIKAVNDSMRSFEEDVGDDSIRVHDKFERITQLFNCRFDLCFYLSGRLSQEYSEPIKHEWLMYSYTQENHNLTYSESALIVKCTNYLSH